MRDRFATLLAEFPQSPAIVRLLDGRAWFDPCDELRFEYGERWQDIVITRGLEKPAPFISRANVTVTDAADGNEILTVDISMMAGRAFAGFDPELKIAGETRDPGPAERAPFAVGDVAGTNFVYRFSVQRDQLNAVQFGLRCRYAGELSRINGVVFRIDFPSFLEPAKGEVPRP